MSLIYRSVRKFSTLTESNGPDLEYQAIVTMRVVVKAANAGEAAYLAAEKAGAVAAEDSVDVIEVTELDTMEKNKQ